MLTTITVAARFKAFVLTVWILGRGFESNSRLGCLSSYFCILMSYVGRRLETADPSSNESTSYRKNDFETSFKEAAYVLQEL
jgi:hypothetical protein